MATIHVVRMTFMTAGLRPELTQIHLGKRQVDLRLGHAPNGSRLLVTTDTPSAELPATHTDDRKTVTVRRHPTRRDWQLIDVNGRVLDKALTHAWVPRPNMGTLSASLMDALAEALPDYEFV